MGVVYYVPYYLSITEGQNTVLTDSIVAAQLKAIASKQLLIVQVIIVFYYYQIK